MFEMIIQAIVFPCALTMV